MSGRRMTDREKEEFIAELCNSDPVFEANYNAMLKAIDRTETTRSVVEQWLIQSARARGRRAEARLL